jgi:hypothetical protein
MSVSTSGSVANPLISFGLIRIWCVKINAMKHLQKVAKRDPGAALSTGAAVLSLLAVLEVGVKSL